MNPSQQTLMNEIAKDMNNSSKMASSNSNPLSLSKLVRQFDQEQLIEKEMMHNTEKNIRGQHKEKEILSYRFTNSPQQQHSQLNLKAFSVRGEDHKNYISNNRHLQNKERQKQKVGSLQKSQKMIQQIHEDKNKYLQVQFEYDTKKSVPPMNQKQKASLEQIYQNLMPQSSIINGQSEKQVVLEPDEDQKKIKTILINSQESKIMKSRERLSKVSSMAFTFGNENADNKKQLLLTQTFKDEAPVREPSPKSQKDFNLIIKSLEDLQREVQQFKNQKRIQKQKNMIKQQRNESKRNASKVLKKYSSRTCFECQKEIQKQFFFENVNTIHILQNFKGQDLRNLYENLNTEENISKNDNYLQKKEKVMRISKKLQLPKIKDLQIYPFQKYLVVKNKFWNQLLFCYFYSGKLYIGDYTKSANQIQRNGKGLEFKFNSFIYSGWWKNNVKNGYGQMFQGNQYYCGDWKNDMRDGLGILENYSSRYEGSFIKNKKHGMGEQKFIDGTTYRGQYHNNLFEGQGIYTSREGGVYRGYFREGKKVNIHFEDVPIIKNSSFRHLSSSRQDEFKTLNLKANQSPRIYKKYRKDKQMIGNKRPIPEQSQFIHSESGSQKNMEGFIFRHKSANNLQFEKYRRRYQ